MLTISTRSRYGLKALLKIAQQEGEGLACAEDIANSEGIPKKYLESILSTLSKSGILASSRGKEGGYRLAKAKEATSLLSVIEALEGSVLKYECGDSKEGCARAELCAPHRFWTELRGSLTDFLASRSISDLLDQDKEAR